MERENSWGRSPGGGGFNSPQGFYQRGGGSPRYNHRGGRPSPYGRGGGQSPFRPAHHPFATSTPIHRPYNQHQHQYRPRFQGGGRGRFNSPKGFQQEQGIEAWISPAMWEDPWKELIQRSKGQLQDAREVSESSINCEQHRSISTTQFADINASESDERNSNDKGSLSEFSSTTPLSVSDMIMKSTTMELEEQNHSSSDPPLPDISLKMQQKESTPETEEAKDLLTLITS